jgi:hypothetical protein
MILDVLHGDLEPFLHVFFIQKILDILQKYALKCSLRRFTPNLYNVLRKANDQK